jgi:hypothetical protein
MQERASALMGQLEIITAPDQGCRITVIFSGLLIEGMKLCLATEPPSTTSFPD